MSLAALPLFKKPKSQQAVVIPQRSNTEEDPADVQLGAETEEDVLRKKKGKRRFQRTLATTANQKSGLNTGK